MWKRYLVLIASLQIVACGIIIIVVSGGAAVSGNYDHLGETFHKLSMITGDVIFVIGCILVFRCLKLIPKDDDNDK